MDRCWRGTSVSAKPTRVSVGPEVVFQNTDALTVGEGLRHIVEAGEWRNPTWRYPGFDSVDFGLELETESGSVFSVTWAPPGMYEGIGLREQPNALVHARRVPRDGEHRAGH